MTRLRDDIRLAAYAVALGYEVRGHSDQKLVPSFFNDDGLPMASLQFTIGDVHVWDTARGWRFSRLIGGRYELPTASNFFGLLKDALDAGERNWRDRGGVVPSLDKRWEDRA